MYPRILVERYLQVTSWKSWKRHSRTPTIQTSTSVKSCPSRLIFPKTGYRYPHQFYLLATGGKYSAN